MEKWDVDPWMKAWKDREENIAHRALFTLKTLQTGNTARQFCSNFDFFFLYGAWIAENYYRSESEGLSGFSLAIARSESH